MSDGQTGRDQMCRAFVRFAGSLATDFDVVELLDGLAGSCVELLDLAVAGLMIADPHGRTRVIATSAEQSEVLELLELQHDSGPCPDARRDGVLVQALTAAEQEQRWPLLAAALRARDLGPVYALPMRLRGETVGALNLFCHPGPGIAEADLELAQALADVATVAMVQYRAIRAGQPPAEYLQAALHSRIAIEQAKGLVAEHAGLDMDGAFVMLHAHARRTATPLSQLCIALVARQLPVDVVIAAAADL